MSQFLFYFSIYLLLLSSGLAALLWTKLKSYKQLQDDYANLRELNEALGTTENKRENINEFINDLPDGSLISKVVIKWIELQRSLSNFQKYDFDIHISAFLKAFRIDFSAITKNLLLVGLLITFVFLSSTLIQMNSSDKEVQDFVTDIFLPDIGNAISSTVAAIFLSFIVTYIGGRYNRLISKLHAELSDFLILHVHPSFETANAEDLFSQMQSALTGIIDNIRDSNKSIKQVNQKSQDALDTITKGVIELSNNSKAFNRSLENFEKTNESFMQSNEQIATTVEKLNASVDGIKVVFSAENEALSKIQKSMQSQADTTNEQTKYLKETSVAYQEVNSSLSLLNEAIDANNTHMNSLKKKIDVEIIDALHTEINGMGEAVTSLNSHIEDIGPSVKGILSDVTEQSEKAIKELESSLRSIEDQFLKGTQKLVNNSIEEDRIIKNDLEGNRQQLSNILEEFGVLNEQINRAIHNQKLAQKKGLIEKLFERK